MNSATHCFAEFAEAKYFADLSFAYSIYFKNFVCIPNLLHIYVYIDVNDICTCELLKYIANANIMKLQLKSIH